MSYQPVLNNHDFSFFHRVHMAMALFILFIYLFILFIINDVILTAFRIILSSTWLYNYLVSLVYSPRLPFFHDKNYTALLTESFHVSMTH